MRAETDVEEFIEQFETYVQLGQERWLSYTYALCSMMCVVRHWQDNEAGDNTVKDHILDKCSTRHERLAIGDQFWTYTRPRGLSITQSLIKLQQILF